MTKTICSVTAETDYDLKAWRLLDGDGNQIAAMLFNHNERGWVLKFIWHQGSGYVRGKTVSIGWRTDSARWKNQFRGIRKPLFGIEISTSANGPYMSR
jgi:hypothetical protein